MFICACELCNVTYYCVSNMVKISAKLLTSIKACAKLVTLLLSPQNAYIFACCFSKINLINILNWFYFKFTLDRVLKME